MLQTAIRTTELVSLMGKHMKVVLAMSVAKLDLTWATEFSSSQLTVCCERIAEYFIDPEQYDKEIQRELLQNETFALWLSQFRNLACQGEGEKLTAPDWSALQRGLIGLLEACRQNRCDITAYPAEDVFAALEHKLLSDDACLTYLENFAPMNLSCGAGAQLAANLNACNGLPAALTDEQRALLVKPFVATRCLFAMTDFPDIAELFSLFPELTEIALLLHQQP